MPGKLEYSVSIPIRWDTEDSDAEDSDVLTLESILVEDSQSTYYRKYNKRVYLRVDDPRSSTWLTKEEALELCKHILTVLDMQGEL